MAVEGYILGIIGIAGTMLTILGAGIPLSKGVQAAAAAVAEKQRLNIFILIYRFHLIVFKHIRSFSNLWSTDCFCYVY